MSASRLSSLNRTASPTLSKENELFCKAFGGVNYLPPRNGPFECLIGDERLQADSLTLQRLKHLCPRGMASGSESSGRRCEWEE